MKHVLAIVLLILGLAVLYKGYSNSDDEKRTQWYVVGAVLILLILPMVRRLWDV